MTPVILRSSRATGSAARTTRWFLALEPPTYRYWWRSSRCFSPELGQDHHRSLEPLERVDAGREDRARLDGLGQAEAVDRPGAPQAALVLARGRQHDDVLERDLLLLDQVPQHHREQVLEILLALVPEDLDGLTLGAAGDRFLLALVEDRDELADLLGVPQVAGDRSHPVLLADRQGSPVQVLVVVGEHVQEPVVGIRLEREQRGPPPLAEVLPLVHHDRVVPRPEPGRGLGERLGEPVLEVRGAGPGLLRRQLDPGLLRQPDTELVERRDVDPGDVADGGAEMVTEPAVEAREQRPMPGRRELLGNRDGEQRLAASRRTDHGRPAPMEHEREHPRLIRGELDDLLVFLVEPQLERRTDLDAEPERHRDGLHPLRAEPSPRTHPGPHHQRNAFGEPREVVAIDHDLGGRARMRRGRVRPVGERHAEPVARLPPFPARLALEDPNERVHRALRLVERVLVEHVRPRVAGLGPALRGRVEGDPAALHLEREQPELGVRDHEVGLPFVAAGPPADHPVDGVVDHELVAELLEEAFVQTAFGRAVGGEHRERHHPGHGGMLARVPGHGPRRMGPSVPYR